MRVRAAYDFLLLRCAAGEVDAELEHWWTQFLGANAEQRVELIAQAARRRSAGSESKRSGNRRRRRPANAKDRAHEPPKPEQHS